MKKQRNIRKKSDENLQKRRFQAYFRHFRLEKISSKIGHGHVFGIANTHLCAKNLKRILMKSRENAKKTGFPAYFLHFGQEFFFSKFGLGRISGITILHLCAKNQKSN